MEKDAPQRKLVGVSVKLLDNVTERCATLNRNTLITRESLRPPCKRQRTRSTTKQDYTDQKEHADVNDVSDGTITSTNADNGLNQPKCRRRQWEQWSCEDQERFFQGVAEFGKDYTKIQVVMRKRARGRHDCEPKTKEQIRHYYHRTWSKVAKNLKLPPELDTKKACRREIHYMICLGELRKKGALGFGPKVMRQLDELVTQGTTNIRYKSRNIRVRPPNRFLRKLYKSTFPLLPKHINIEFLPHTNFAFNFVQKHAFNPRLRFNNVNINANFSEIFEMFDKRFTDIHSNTSLDLYIYPLQIPNNDSVEFSRILTEAKDKIATQENDSPIILEEATKTPSPKREEGETASTDEDETFPKIFGKINKATLTPPSKSEPTSSKPFPGYWTVLSAEQISLRTLYLALGENELLKFKYDWKLDKKHEHFSLQANSFQILQDLCIAGKEKKKETEKTKKTLTVPSEQLPVVVPGVIKKDFPIPLRPRPGRQVMNRNRILSNRSIIPRVNMTGSTNKLLNNAVAVNLIPQPQQLLQFADMNKTKFVNTGSSSVGLFNAIQGASDVVVTEATSSSSSGVIYEEVIDEGCNADFKALNNFITTLAKKTNNGETQVVGKLETKDLVNPKSPNLDWLNGESADLSMTSFINVDRQQRQQELAAAATKKLSDSATTSNFQDSIDGMKASVDPTLPEFHSGDTNGSLFNVNFS